MSNFNNYSFNSVSCPCQGCDKRSPECHGSCNLYAQYKKDYACAKQQEAETKAIDRLGKPLSRRQNSKR